MNLMKPLTIRLLRKRGVCRWCGCTDRAACDGGCSWVDKRHTLCSACLEFDGRMKSAAGRRELVQKVQEVGL